MAKGVAVKAGGYSFVARGMTHYAWFTEKTVLQLHGIGPQDHLCQSGGRSAEEVATYGRCLVFRSPASVLSLKFV
jgi:hypothetical protein